MLDYPHLARPLFFEFRHVSFLVAILHQRRRAFAKGMAAHTLPVPVRLLLKGEQQQLLRRGGAEQSLRGFEDVDRHLVARRRKKIMRPRRQPVEHLWPAAFPRLTPGIDQTALLQVETDSLD